jgi:DNA adenine methylase
MIRKNVKPFLKWAGGKTQLIAEIEKNLPNSAVDKKFTYVEPFVGSGAVLFWMISEFSLLEKAVVNDINEDLINTYKSIKSTHKELISILEIMQKEYHSLENSEDKKKEYYYQKRELFNNRKQSQTEHSALFIFLNRTCFNGLYRVNRKNEFNVPMGSYKKPTICDKANISAVNEALQKVELLCGDFEQTVDYTGSNTLFYFDPPYKPLSETSSFNSYAKDEFNDDEQIRLKNFCNRLDSLGHSWILSNSDVKGTNAEDSFFDDLYAKFIIKRVDAKRSINANPEKRGFLKELLITNQVNNQNYVRTD